MDGGTVLQAAGECRAFLGGILDRDWTLPIPPDMDWTVAQAVAHIGEVLLWYATDLAAGQPILPDFTVERAIGGWIARGGAPAPSWCSACRSTAAAGPG